MPVSAEQNSWVARVLGVSAAPPEQQAAPRAEPAMVQDALGDGLGNDEALVQDSNEGIGFFDKIADGLADVKAKITGVDPRKDTKQSLLARLSRLTDPADASAEDKKRFAALRVEINRLLAPDAPPAPDLASANDAIVALTQAIETARRKPLVDALAPKAKAAALAAFKAMDDALGGEEITPAALKTATDDRIAKDKAFDEARTALSKAKTGGNKKAIEQATAAYSETRAAAAAAYARENTLKAPSALFAALSHGPLSAECGKPFAKPETSAKLIAAFAQDAQTASAALKAARTARYPDAIADNVSALIGQAANGFATTKGGNGFASPSYARTYAQDLLMTGGEVGPEYFSRLTDYIASGEQFKPDPTGGAGAKTFVELGHKRSVALAGKLLRPDGTVDADSAGAKAAIGNLLFHPTALLNKTPELDAHVLKTVQFLSGNAATNSILKAIPQPSSPGAKTLVNASLGTSGDPTAAQARTAVLAAMLKPVQQGNVGSCFATAPTRRLREDQPVEALKSFADLASTGTYQPPFGQRVPAVTNLPTGEDPLVKSCEFSVATAAAREASSNQRNGLAASTEKGADLLKDLAVKGVKDTDKDAAWSGKRAKLLADIAGAFTFTYDPMSSITDSSDGSSDQGRYVIERLSDGKQIRSEGDYVDAISALALTSLGIDANSPEAADIRAKIAAPAFIAAVCPDKYKPWALPSGGQTTEATKTLFGKGLAEKQMLAQAGTPLPDEGKRTSDVLESFLDNFSGSTANMVTIRTVGQHGFNALPNNPTLAPLQGATALERKQKVKANLIDVGTALKDKDLSAERAGNLFDEAIAVRLAEEKDDARRQLIEAGAQSHRPAAAMKPAGVTAAVAAALDAYDTAVADKGATDWAAGQKTAPAADALLKKKQDLLKAHKEKSEAIAKTELMRDLGAPQFVIADTNWGDPRDHTYFVIAPDPATGAPLLWKKTDPPGSMRPAGREWVDKTWSSVQ